MKRSIALSFLCVLMQLSCAKEHVFKKLPDGPVNHHMIVLAKVKDGAKLRGFAGATPPGTEIACAIKNAKGKTKSSADGSFVLEIANTDPHEQSGTITFNSAGVISEKTYTIKNLPDALKNITDTPFTTDKEIDSIEFVGSNAYILSSQGALVQSFAIDQQWRLSPKSTMAFLLNRDAYVAIGARMIKSMGDMLLAPLFNTHEIAVVDRQTGGLIAKSRLKNDTNQLHIFPVNPNLTVKTPIDADGVNASTNISKTAARNAEAVVAIDKSHFLVSFDNYFQFADASTGREAVVGPGIIGLMALENNQLKTIATMVLPYKNPSQFVKKDDLTFWISCSGVWQHNQGGFTSSDAGLVRIAVNADFTGMSLTNSISLDSFSPAPIALVGSKLIVPRSWGNDIAVIDESATTITESDKKTHSYHRPFNFTFATNWHDGIIFLGDNQGSLIAYSLTEGFFPFPFVEPIYFYKDADKKLALGPLKLYFRHSAEGYDIQTTHKDGYDAWVTTAVHRLLPLDFLAVFGP
jgi:hypothetical protein